MALSTLTLTSCEKDGNTDPANPPADNTTLFTISHSVNGGDGLDTPFLYMDEFAKFVKEKVGNRAEVSSTMITTKDPEGVKKVLATITTDDLKNIALKVSTKIHVVRITIREGEKDIVNLEWQKVNNDPSNHAGTYTFTENGKTFTLTVTANPTDKEGYNVSSFIVPEGFEGIEPGTYTGGTRAYGYTHIQFESDKRNKAGSSYYLKVLLDLADAESGTFTGNIGVEGKSWKADIPFTKE